MECVHVVISALHDGVDAAGFDRDSCDDNHVVWTMGLLCNFHTHSNCTPWFEGFEENYYRELG